ncbi:hypothetical protein ACVRG2_003507, partial [Shigella dysenteriae]
IKTSTKIKLSKRYCCVSGRNNIRRGDVSNEASDDQRVYRVYGSWMAENFQDQVSILNQK